MKEELIKSWCNAGKDELSNYKRINSVQSSKIIKGNIIRKCNQLNEVAKIAYGNWIKGL